MNLAVVSQTNLPTVALFKFQHKRCSCVGAILVRCVADRSAFWAPYKIMSKLNLRYL